MLTIWWFECNPLALAFSAELRHPLCESNKSKARVPYSKNVYWQSNTTFGNHACRDIPKEPNIGAAHAFCIRELNVHTTCNSVEIGSPSSRNSECNKQDPPFPFPENSFSVQCCENSVLRIGQWQGMDCIHEIVLDPLRTILPLKLTTTIQLTYQLICSLCAPGATLSECTVGW